MEASALYESPFTSVAPDRKYAIVLTGSLTVSRSAAPPC